MMNNILETMKDLIGKFGPGAPWQLPDAKTLEKLASANYTKCVEWWQANPTPASGEYEIRCDGSLLNPCRGLTREQADGAFKMYTSAQSTKGHKFTLSSGGKELMMRETSKTSGAAAPKKEAPAKK